MNRSVHHRVRAVISEAADDGVPFRAKSGHSFANWARTFSCFPELYIQPESQAEIEKVIRLARLCRRRIAIAGHGHSPSDLTCTTNWLVNLDNFNQVISVDPSSRLVVMQAGIRLWQLTEILRPLGLSFPILASINVQSIAGAISTGTRGSSLRHGLMSEAVEAIDITLGSGETVSCSPDHRPDLFRGALLSLGALGIITRVTLRVVEAYSLSWVQTIQSDAEMLASWGRDNELWRQSDLVRVWWLPHTRRAVVWRADVVTADDLGSGRVAHRAPAPGWFGGAAMLHLHRGLLWLARFAPWITPSVEWLLFGLQFGFRNGASSSAVEPMDKAVWLDCLYSQYVNEWAIPLDRGPEALRRLSSWLNQLPRSDPGYVPHGIPFPSAGVYAHAPIEVRVCDSTLRTSAEGRNRPWLDSTVRDGPTLNINATLYRPFGLDPPQLRQWYRAFEWLMRDLGGRPHWAKNFSATPAELLEWYGDDLRQWRRVRAECDPGGLFVGPWHREHVLGPEEPGPLEFEEKEGARVNVGRGTTTYGTLQMVPG